MRIKRWICDFGNSINQQLIDGQYFEMPSSIYEIDAREAHGIFAETVHKEQLLKQLVIRVIIDGQDRYFKVGEKAKSEILADAHIYKLHDKTESLTVFVTWLAGIAFYHARLYPVIDAEETIQIDVDYFFTLLPVWLVRKADKFSQMLTKMADRFKVPSEVQLLTSGFERTLHISVVQSVCRVEGETARFALKYDLELNELESAKKYSAAHVVINDLGGQSQDLSKLQPNLQGAQSVDDFDSCTDQSYLSMLEKLRTRKLMTHFQDVRALETFILDNVSTNRFIYIDPISKEESDFTEIIQRELTEFARIAMQKALTTFKFSHGQSVYYVHIGGVNQILEAYMRDALVNVLGEVIVNEFHVFPADSRKLNVYSGEILAKSEMKRNEQHDTQE